ncbi:hypothetical protein N0V83_008749 [Neocucurbitaria cava]|uniref:Uncharacterized protein n=1 Tax=Neocucurbitaria cava TaxID=798079 RepID=A0A9W9CI88_9PLEO|nr:hypothetical protein N0V83_008749 [Neocucurbitaria cava]
MTILQSLSRASPVARRSFQQRGQSVPAALSRTYTQKDGASPGKSSNVSNPQASSAESQEINQKAAHGRTDKNDADHASIQTPVSHPEQDRAVATEETTQSQDAMKHDPNEPAGTGSQKKKKKTLEYGQNKPLDAADK